jgi:UDP-glucose 4-epimerase
VVGGAGYIGSHVSMALLEAGHQVLVLDNLRSGHRSNLPPGAVFKHADLMVPSSLDAALEGEGCDGAIHLAALKAAGESMLEPEKYSTQNIAGSMNLFHALMKAGVSRLVFSSTAAVYGEPKAIPMDETHPTSPENWYGATKLAVEGILDWYGKLKNFRHVNLRYFNAAGYDAQGRIRGLEMSPANLLPVVMEAAAGLRAEVQVFGDDYPTRDGTGVRDYIHVSDLADAHVRALGYLEKGGEDITVNLGTGAGITVLEIIAATEKVTGRKVPFRKVPRRFGDADTVIASSAKAEKILGWKAQHSDVQTLVESTWEVYRHLAK